MLTYCSDSYERIGGLPFRSARIGAIKKATHCLNKENTDLPQGAVGLQEEEDYKGWNGKCWTSGRGNKVDKQRLKMNHWQGLLI